MNWLKTNKDSNKDLDARREAEEVHRLLEIMRDKQDKEDKNEATKKK